MQYDPFKEYIKEVEPSKKEKGYAWHTAIGLQAVDGLSPSQYLIDTAIRNIEGDISIDEANQLLTSYYEENPKQDINDRTEEADKVSLRIVKILSEKAFSFTPNEYISIHKKYSQVYTTMRVNYVIIILQKKNGSLMVKLFYMAVHPN